MAERGKDLVRLLCRGAGEMEGDGERISCVRGGRWRPRGERDSSFGRDFGFGSAAGVRFHAALFEWIGLLMEWLVRDGGARQEVGAREAERVDW